MEGLTAGWSAAQAWARWVIVALVCAGLLGAAHCAGGCVTDAPPVDCPGADSLDAEVSGVGPCVARAVLCARNLACAGSLQDGANPERWTECVERLPCPGDEACAAAIAASPCDVLPAECDP